MPPSPAPADKHQKNPRKLRGFFYDSMIMVPIKNIKTNAAAILNVIDNSSIVTPPLSFIWFKSIIKCGKIRFVFKAVFCQRDEHFVNRCSEKLGFILNTDDTDSLLLKGLLFHE